jgi:hypothetical protein
MFYNQSFHYFFSLLVFAGRFLASFMISTTGFGGGGISSITFVPHVWQTFLTPSKASPQFKHLMTLLRYPSATTAKGTVAATPFRPVRMFPQASARLKSYPAVVVPMLASVIKRLSTT